MPASLSKFSFEEEQGDSSDCERLNKLHEPIGHTGHVRYELRERSFNLGL